MHKLRVFLALVFGALIVIWLTTWYRQHPDREIASDPLQPLWNKIAVLTERVGRKTSPDNTGTTTVPTWTPKPIQGTGVLVVIPQLHPDFMPGTISISDLKGLTDTSTTFGEENAPLVLLQWCDFGSSYCIESYEKASLFEYMTAFPEQLSYQFKWYPRNNDTTTILQHQAALCAESLADKELYLSFYFSLYQSRGGLTKDEILLLAERLEIDGFETCLETKNTFALQQEMKRGRTLFGFSSLPANVLVNKETGDFVLIPGLYATQDVLQAIQWLLEKNS
jgi:hypothetical protein